MAPQKTLSGQTTHKRTRQLRYKGTCVLVFCTFLIQETFFEKFSFIYSRFVLWRIIKHELQISLKRYVLSMEDTMAAEALGRARNYGCLLDKVESNLKCWLHQYQSNIVYTLLLQFETWRNRSGRNFTIHSTWSHFIRIHPIPSGNSRTCMRIGLYGCDTGNYSDYLHVTSRSS